MDVVVETRRGKLRGRLTDGVATFKGVPCAAPPFGANRLRLAELVGAGEDCLTLNVWTPHVGTAGRPVMVWIPGGMFEFHATGASAFYGGSRFARDGVMCVTTASRTTPSRAWRPPMVCRRRL